MISNILNPKLKKDDRVLVLEPIDGKPRSVTGLVDIRLFSGENNLHLIRSSNNMWKASYDSGTLPRDLKQSWSSFREAVKFLEGYYAKRNVRIARVND